MKKLIFSAIALGVLMMTTVTGNAQTHAAKVLVLVTSANTYAGNHATGVWLEEFTVPYLQLVHAGATVTVASPKGGDTPIDPGSQATPEQAKEWALAIEALHHTAKVESLKAEDFDAIFVPGGHGPLADLAVDPQVAKLISDFARAGKPVAAVCHGPAALLGATLADGTPLVKGHKFTVFSDSEEKAAGLADVVPFSVEQKLVALGGEFSKGPNFGAYAIADRGLVTGQNPASSQKVGELLLAEIAKSHK